jgi:hypothetical protein
MQELKGTMEVWKVMQDVSDDRLDAADKTDIRNLIGGAALRLQLVLGFVESKNYTFGGTILKNDTCRDCGNGGQAISSLSLVDTKFADKTGIPIVGLKQDRFHRYPIQRLKKKKKSLKKLQPVAFERKL